jgi:diadenosine tetraphosphate (Ap4A) HIT family hydrolase
LTDIPDDQLAEILPAAKKIATAVGAESYNILQNNGRLAHQVVDHVRYTLHLGYSTFTTLMLANVHCSVLPIVFSTHLLNRQVPLGRSQRDDRLLRLALIVLTVESQVHFHVIPKPNEQEGLGIGWPAQQTDMDGLKKLHEALKAKM